MASFIPEPPSITRTRALEGARKRAAQRPIAAELRYAISDAGLLHAPIEKCMRLKAGRLSELLECSTVWSLDPHVFRAVVLAAIAEVSA